ncbi:ABC transporter transmembrane region domain-containing protein [Ditylenchus destructor]|uniref:ABC-type antigen peptide transporter n=1 Tax=Ditylenchus destructor TaxID=166010 RepID=A0AAD4R1J3_9BILA|nr:ABC transporter transmembrane region domain-containing protein [Ditylenchus destructor]
MAEIVNLPSRSAWYSPIQALLLSIVFVFIDIIVNIFGLAWDGKFFTVDNISHWFDFRYYNFTINPVDFMVVAIVRDCVLLGGALGVYFNPRGGAEACAKFSNCTFAVILLIVAFSPSKLLAFYENEDLKLAVGDWILMSWSIIASLFVQAIWVSVFARVREDSYGQVDRRRFFDNDEEDEYFAKLQEKEAILEAQKRETFAMLFRLFTYMAKEWPYYCVAFFFLLLYSLTRVFVPYLTGEVVASVFGAEASYEKLHNCVMIMAVITLSSAVFGGFRGGFFTYSQSRIDRRIRDDLFRSLVQQEIGFFDENKTGEICSRLTSDCQTMSNTLSLYMNVLTRNLTMLVGSLMFMFSLSWRLTLVTFIAVPIIFLVSKVYGVYYDKLAEDGQKSVAEANSVAEEVLSAIRTVKSFACEKFESLRFLVFLNVTLGIGAKKAVAHIGFLLTTEFLQMGILTVVLFYGGHLVIQEKITSGLLVSFLLYQFQLGENLRELGEVWNGLMQAVGSSRKVFDLIDRKPKFQNNGRIAPDGRNATMEGKIEFRNVKFSYPTRPDIPVMQDLSFTVEPGEVVALVGPSGGGKSSCIAMLEHFYEPEEGEVLLDGVPIRDYDHQFLHTKVALVGQEPILYARSVHENIGYGYPAARTETVQRAAKMANAHGFIMDTHEGYDTDVGEKGSQMSGGQKQRIAIARALVREPVVLLLDEATSALDSESEHLVQEAIQKNLKGRTVLLIAGGRVVQQGKHQELIQREGIYKQLVQRQMLAGDFSDDIQPPKAELPRDVPVLPRPRGKSRRIGSNSPSVSGAAQSFIATSFAGSYI